MELNPPPILRYQQLGTGEYLIYNYVILLF